MFALSDQSGCAIARRAPQDGSMNTIGVASAAISPHETD